jgi:glycosyltransferase involved in cell wall biosynthesis
MPAAQVFEQIPQGGARAQSGLEGVADGEEIGGDAVSSFDPFDLEDTKKVLLTLIDFPEIREKQIRLGNELSRSFSWDNSAKEIGKIASDAVHLHA